MEIIQLMDFNFTDKVHNKTDKELTEIYMNSNQFQPEFIQIVLEELNRRNIQVDSMEYLKDQKKQIEATQLALGRQGNPIYMALAFFSVLASGIPTIVAGYIYSQSKHKDQDGNKYYVYNESTRRLGKIMIVLGCVVLVITLIMQTRHAI